MRYGTLLVGTVAINTPGNDLKPYGRPIFRIGHPPALNHPPGFVKGTVRTSHSEL